MFLFKGKRERRSCDSQSRGKASPHRTGERCGDAGARARAWPRLGLEQAGEREALLPPATLAGPPATPGVRTRPPARRPATFVLLVATGHSSRKRPLGCVHAGRLTVWRWPWGNGVEATAPPGRSGNHTRSGGGTAAKRDGAGSFRGLASERANVLITPRADTCVLNYFYKKKRKKKSTHRGCGMLIAACDGDWFGQCGGSGKNEQQGGRRSPGQPVRGRPESGSAWRGQAGVGVSLCEDGRSPGQPVRGQAEVGVSLARTGLVATCQRSRGVRGPPLAEAACALSGATLGGARPQSRWLSREASASCRPCVRRSRLLLATCLLRLLLCGWALRSPGELARPPPRPPWGASTDACVPPPPLFGGEQGRETRPFEMPEMRR